MKSLFLLLGLVALMALGCNAPQKPVETTAPQEQVAPETADTVAKQLDQSKAEIDQSVQELDKAVKDLE